MALKWAKIAAYLVYLHALLYLAYSLAQCSCTVQLSIAPQQVKG